MEIALQIITSVLTFAGVIVANHIQHNSTVAVLEERIKTLTDEVHKHNSFATKIPVMEEKLQACIARIDKLERKVHHDD